MTDFSVDADPALSIAGAPELPDTAVPELPAYLQETYAWAYLWPISVRLLDRPWITSAILWGNYRRLKRAAFSEIPPGQRVLQTACVYGDLSYDLGALVGPRGRLDVIDVAPIQVANCRRKLNGVGHAHVRLADAAAPGGGPYDVVCCFFLLHELPDDRKRAVIDSLLSAVVPGGSVVFVDYHKPRSLHPLRGLMSIVFDWLEPFAKTLWRREISSFAPAADRFDWRKETYFGGLYQKVVARRRIPSDPVPSGPA
ncbi:MAG: class I SAM-dependent methyltransferase [Inquilinus sp.]|nr:class I SAM-dependent methyltransferase [Inquilinus sp.]